MFEKRILIAGIGNIFFGDDAFGCETIKKIKSSALPPSIKIIDFGIKTRDLAFELAAGNYDLTIIVDAVKRGESPGTIYLIELPTRNQGEQKIFAAHDLKLGETIRFARELGAEANKILLVGCEPANLTGENLSEAVESAIDKACDIILKIVSEKNDER